jgi:hypothetical protein
MLVIVHEEFISDLSYSFTWYESKEYGLGRRFTSSIKASIKKIKDAPLARACVYPSVRKARVKGYPYSIFYSYSDSTLKNLALSHDR